MTEPSISQENEVDGEAAAEDSLPDPPRPRLWLWLTVAAVGYAIGRLVPLPGIDHEAMAALADAGAMSGLSSTLISPFGLDLGAMVLIHFVLIATGKFDNPLARRVGLGIWLLIAAIQAFSLTLQLESLNGAPPFVDVVYEPGYGFRLTTTLALVAGAALLWFLASRIDRSGRAYGAPFLWLIATASTFVGELSNTGRLIGLGAPPNALVSFIWPVGGVALAALTVLWPRTWPVPVFGSVRLRSGWDVLALTVLGTLPQAIVASASWSAALGALLLFALVGGFALFWLRLTPGDEPTRAWGPAIAAAAYFVLCAVVLIGSVLSTGSVSTLAESFGPGPLHGENRFAIELVTDGRFDRGDAEALANRLERLGAGVTVERQDPQHILLRIEAASVGAVESALRPTRLRISLAHELSTDPFSGALEPRTGPQGSTAFAGSCEQVEAQVEALALRELPEAEDCDWLTQRTADQCVTYCVERTAVVTRLDVARASTTADPYSGVPAVMVTLTDDAAERFGAFTAEHTTRTLAVVVDDEVLTAPVIQGAIPGGRVQITMGTMGEADRVHMREEADALAAALDGPSIATHYEISQVMLWSELDSD